MPKTIVTQELADSLKMIRLQNNIPSKLVAEHIKKSPAYISRLEKGEIKTIDSFLLDSILEFICGDNIESGEIVSKLYDTLTVRYSKEEIEKQVWFTNYDRIARRIPIPEQLIDEINDLLKENDISRTYLLERINANEALTAEEKSDDSIEYNRWYSKNEGKNTFIKIKLSIDSLNMVLDGQRRSASYTLMLSILFYVLKIIHFGENTNLSEYDNKDLMGKATQKLNSHKFYSIAEKNRILSSVHTQEQFNELLSTFDIENTDIISDILVGLKYASEADIYTTNSRLKSFDENLKWDLWFMLKVISLQYHVLEDLSTTLKKEFIKKIEDLINTYCALPEDKRKMEMY